MVTVMLMSIWQKCTVKFMQLVNDMKSNRRLILELGGMTKNLYHGIFLNYTGFTVYDGIFFFMHDQVLTTFSTD